MVRLLERERTVTDLLRQVDPTLRTVICNLLFSLAIPFEAQELLAVCLKKLSRTTILQCSELGNCLTQLFHPRLCLCVLESSDLFDVN